MVDDGGTLKICGSCGGTYEGESHVNCPTKGGATPVPSGPALEGTIKACPDCGQTFTGDSHVCSSSGGTLKKPPSSKSGIDDLPGEAAEFAEDPGRQLDQYILVKQIGKGGMGAVWKAWDRKLTRWVAIKFLLAGEDEDVERFQREAKLAARLRHPNIAPIYEVGESPPQQAGQVARHYLAMEFIDGQSLGKVKLPLKDMLDVFVKVAAGMEAAHRAGVVHRDLKPPNIMLTSDGWPYVMDFGLAKALEAESSLSVSGAVMGTPAYMPPEQAQGHLDQIDAQSDVYSLGATLYAVLCQKQPFIGQSPMEIVMRVVREEPIPPRKHDPEIPEPVERIILKAMAKDKPARYASAAEMAEDLQKFLRDEDISARIPPRRSSGGKLALMAGGALVMVVVGVVLYFMSPAPEPPEKTPTAQPRPTLQPPPNLTPKGPSAAEKALAWKQGWLEDRGKIAYFQFKPGDKELPGTLNARLAGLAELPQIEVNEVKAWFRAEMDDAERDLDDWLSRPRDQWLKRHADATKVGGWCDALEGALRDVEVLRAVHADIPAVRSKAARLLAFKGTFRLRVYVMGARVAAVRKNGSAVALPSAPETPFVMNLDVASYEVELSHSKGGKGKVVLKSPEHGKTMTVVGTVAAPRVVVK